MKEKNQNIEEKYWQDVARACETEARSGESEKLSEVRTLLQKVDLYFRAAKFDTDAGWKSVQRRIAAGEYPAQKRKAPVRWLKDVSYYAAALLLAAMLGAGGYWLGAHWNKPAVITEVIAGHRQVLHELVLPDGTVVALNSDSKLLYPRNFPTDRREVSLMGEGFFDVKPNPDKPFIINAGTARIKVVGTSFNVSAYPSAKTVEVVVQSGKVEVDTQNEESSEEQTGLALVPGEKAVVFAETGIVQKELNDDPNYNAWKTHTLVFNKVPLARVVETLEKTYHVQIELSDPTLNSLLYEGHFQQKSVDFILDVIRLSFNLELTGDDQHYKLSSRSGKQ